jgi:hypothetical protein
MFDITCCPHKIHPELHHPARRAIGGLPFPVTRAASREPAETSGDHPRSSGAAVPAKA